MKVETSKYKPEISADYSIWIEDPTVDNSYNFNRTSMLSIEGSNIRIDWCDYVDLKDSVLRFLVVKESRILCFGARTFWGIIDLTKLQINRIEECDEFWYFEKYPESILVIKELEAESINLLGITIDKVPIDSPWESKESNNKIEFESPVFGKQILRLK